MLSEQSVKKEIAKKSVNFDRWYTDVILKAELADYAPVKGCMIIRPYGYAIWEHIVKAFDEMIKKAGVENAYFPVFIPISFLQKEKEHIQGFSPQLAVVTVGGGEKLAEPLVVRPTSETVMYAMYSKWISSWRDLPLLINQWNNIVRWEKRTFLFLRTTEFLWQEGHTVHETKKEAFNFALKALDWYRQIYQNYLAISPIVGVKSASEKFAGGDTTWAVELLMPDGLALQGATSHYLGQNFAKVFHISFQNRQGKNEYVYQTSWGLSTRSIGALIMAHGDDHGLVLPPAIAPIQVIIIPIKQNQKIINYCANLKKELEKQDARVKIDERMEKTVGWKFNEWELKGVPIRIEVGEQEVEKNILTVFRRDTGAKTRFLLKSLTSLKNLLFQIQANLLDKTTRFSRKNTSDIDSYDQFKEIMRTKKGLLYAFWCEDPICEKKIKDETKATTRVLPLEAVNKKSPFFNKEGKCVYCGKPASNRWYFAQAY